MREDDGSGASIDQVDHEERERGDGGEEELVTPAKVEDIVGKPQENHAAHREESTEEMSKLWQRGREGRRERERREERGGKRWREKVRNNCIQRPNKGWTP